MQRKPARPGQAAGESAGRPRAEGIAFLVVDGSGRVIRSQGWEAVFDGRPPGKLPAPDGARESIEAAIAGVVKEAQRTGALARATAPGGGGPGGLLSIVAGSLGTGPASRRTAVVIEPRPGSDPAETGEGQAIRKLGHDLRSPLTSIAGAAELLQSGRLGNLTEQQARCLVVLQRGVENLLEMIERATAPYRPGASDNPLGVLGGMASGGGTAGR